VDSLFPALAPGPPGFRLLEEVVTPPEEQALLAWARGLPLEPYVMHDTPSRRLVAAFGVTYALGQRRVAPSPLPELLLPLAARCAHLAGLPPGELAQALVTRYPPGAGIGWHRDRGRYGPTVIGVSLASSCRLRLRPRDRERGRARDVSTVVLPPRSVYVLGGEARATWEHSIPPVASERWSITLRTLR
jgi:alkylated DNA repair protein (DNA oxidative demethylase)